jgi:hypothetical protein
MKSAKQQSILSTGKELKSFIDGYQSVASQEKTNKKFGFYEAVTLEHLDAESKKEIIFGKKTTDFFNKANLQKIQRLVKASTPTPVRPSDDKESMLISRRPAQEEHPSNHWDRQREVHGSFEDVLREGRLRIHQGSQ